MRTDFFPLSFAFATVALAAATPPAYGQQAKSSGEKIYRNQCARCHGDRGQGTDEHRFVLEGDLTKLQLAAFVKKTMPDDDPGILTEDESQQVANYIFDTFYSPIARARHGRPRIELSRLTVRQYRQTLADLVGGFRKPTKWDARRGLFGDYVAHRNIWNRKQRKKRKIDPQIDFDFGTESPIPEIEEPREFSILWHGSVLAPETGEYQFVVRSSHAARLYLNDRTAVIDAWVRSRDETEHSVRLFLIAGRAYPIRLEFSKSKQGVDDSKKQKKKPPSQPASISLLWKRPNGVIQPIPSRQLTPNSAPISYVCSTRFPPDDRSFGWVRGTMISPEWDRATTNGALELASYVKEHLNELAGTKDDADDRLEKLESFAKKFAERAFRQPLTSDEAKFFVQKQFAAVPDPEAAIGRVVLLTLKSPRFLFRELTDMDQYAVASRLSFGLWNSMPDQQLLSAARQGNLSSRDDIFQQAKKMLDDPRAKMKLHQFLINWTQADTEYDLSKDPDLFPGFDEAAMADTRISLELFLSDVVDSEQSDFRRLLSADEIYMNSRLAKLFGVRLPSEIEQDANEAKHEPTISSNTNTTRFEPVKFGLDKRAGVLTHPYLMARFSNRRESSPIHRGVFLARGILGQTLKPPPEAFTPLSPDLHPDLTTRERVALQTKPADCMACHQIINPLGFALEEFDAVGRVRDMDRGKRVDASALIQPGGVDGVKVNGARELAEYLLASENAHNAFCQQLFHHLVGQSMEAYGEDTAAHIRKFFVDNEFSMRLLACEIMAVSASIGRDSTTFQNRNAKDFDK